MIGTFSATDSALLLIDHLLGTMKLINSIPLDRASRNGRPDMELCHDILSHLFLNM
jgi:hypothetical protein